MLVLPVKVQSSKGHEMYDAKEVFEQTPIRCEAVWLVANKGTGDQIDVLLMLQNDDGTIEDPDLEPHREIVGVGYVDSTMIRF
jgi:hypothetical protein